MAATASVEPRPKTPSRGKARISALLPYLLALFFGALPLRDVGRTDVVDTDAARHAMNGVFIYDMVRSGHAAHPVEYAKEYYGRFPAISMPYHPPLFPAIEALFFAVFGVSLFSARLAVALATGIAAVLLYRLVAATLERRTLAACVTVSTFSLWTFQLVSTDVMLEPAAMAFTLAALYCVKDIGRGVYPLSRAMLFAVLAAAAVWTKQHAVFLLGVPVLYAVLTGHWRLILRKPMLLSTVVLAAALVGLISLSAPFNYTGINQVSDPKYSRYFFSRTIPSYAHWIAANMPGIPTVFAAASIALGVLALWRRRLKKTGLALYAAWMVSLAVVLLVTRAVSGRYLLFMMPPTLAIGYTLLFEGCAAVAGERRAWYIPAAFAAAWLAAGFYYEPEFLRGPGESARVVFESGPARVIYAGDADGNFVFAARTLDPKLATTVIPAAKLRHEVFESGAFEKFCRKYGVSWIVLEDVPQQRAWSHLATAPAASMQLDRSVPLESNRERWKAGEMRIYRFTAPPDGPAGALELPVRKMGGSIGVRF